MVDEENSDNRGGVLVGAHPFDGAVAHDASTIAKPPHVVAAAAIEELNSRPLTMSQVCKTDMVRVMQMSFPESRQGEVKARIELYRSVAIVCIENYSLHAFQRERTRFWGDMQRLSQPAPEPTERERIGLAISKLWRGNIRGCPEVDQLFTELRPGEKVKSFDWRGVLIGGPAGERSLTREELRLRDRPRYSTVSEKDWIARYGEIRPPEAALNR